MSRGLRQRNRAEISTEALDCSFIEPSSVEADKASSPVKGHRLRLFWIPALVCFALWIVVARPRGFGTGIFTGSSVEEDELIDIDLES